MSEIAPCAPDLYENGIIVGAYDSSYMGSDGFERMTKATAALTGCECDWHFFAGRAVVKAHKEDFVAVKNAFESIYAYVYNSEGPKWCEKSNMSAHFRKREPEFVSEGEYAFGE